MTTVCPKCKKVYEHLRVGECCSRCDFTVPVVTKDHMTFITKVHTDAYTAALAHMWADCWASGYEAARRDFILAGTDGRGYVERGDPAWSILIKLEENDSFSDLRRRAQREMMKDSERSHIEAMAALAPLLESPVGNFR